MTSPYGAIATLHGNSNRGASTHGGGGEGDPRAKAPRSRGAGGGGGGGSVANGGGGGVGPRGKQQQQPPLLPSKRAPPQVPPVSQRAFLVAAASSGATSSSGVSPEFATSDVTRQACGSRHLESRGTAASATPSATGDVTGLPEEDEDCEEQVPSSRMESLEERCKWLEHKMQQQNQEFWRSASRKDDAIQAEQEEYRAMLERFSDLSASLLLRDKAAERQRTAKDEKTRALAELEAVSSELHAREEQHRADVGALQRQLAAANGRVSTAEASIQDANRKTEQLKLEMSELLDTLKQASNEEASCKSEENSLVEAATGISRHVEEIKEEIASKQVALELAESSINDIGDGRKSAEERWQSELANALASEEEESKQEEESLRQLQSELARSREEAKALEAMKRDADAAETSELASLRTSLQRAKARAISSEEMQQELQLAEANLKKMHATDEELQKEILQARDACSEAQRCEEVEAIVAEEAMKGGDLSRRQMAEAIDRRAGLDGRIAQLQSELTLLGTTEAEARKRLRASEEQMQQDTAMRISNMEMSMERHRCDEEALASDQQQSLAEAEAEIFKTNQLASPAKSTAAAQLAEETGSLELLRRELFMAEQEAEDLARAKAEEQEVASEARGSLEKDALERRVKIEESTAALQASSQELQEAEANLFSELRNEVEACVSAQNKAQNVRAQVLRLEDAERAKHELYEDHVLELAVARADATRNFNAASEYRVELGARRKDAGKQRSAARELEDVLEELRHIGKQTSETQGAKQQTERQLQESRERESYLQQQLRLAMQRLGERRHAIAEPKIADV